MYMFMGVLVVFEEIGWDFGQSGNALFSHLKYWFPQSKCSLLNMFLGD